VGTNAVVAAGSRVQSAPRCILRLDAPVLISDAIIHPMDTDGPLFGFERMAALLGTAVLAREVADAAERFGHEVGISVMNITHTAVLEPPVA
jgi:hypothetical protein